MNLQTCLSRATLAIYAHDSLEVALPLGDKFNAINELGPTTCLEKSFSDGYRLSVPPPRETSPLDRDAFARNMDRLLRAEKKKGTTARAFAQRIGYPEERLSKWRGGLVAVPALSTIIKIAAAFGVSVDDLIAGVDEDYDKAREGLSYKNNLAVVTQPVLGAGVQDELPPKGGHRHAADSARDRVSESQAALNAQVRRGLTEHLLAEISRRLEGSADDVRAAAAELRALGIVPAPRRKPAVGGSSGKGVREAATRRGSKR